MMHMNYPGRLALIRKVQWDVAIDISDTLEKGLVADSEKGLRYMESVDRLFEDIKQKHDVVMHLRDDYTLDHHQRFFDLHTQGRGYYHHYPKLVERVALFDDGAAYRCDRKIPGKDFHPHCGFDRSDELIIPKFYVVGFCEADNPHKYFDMNSKLIDPFREADNQVRWLMSEELNKK